MGIGIPPQLTMSDQQTTTATNGFDANSGSTVFTGAELAVMEQIKQRMKGAIRQRSGCVDSV